PGLGAARWEAADAGSEIEVAAARLAVHEGIDPASGQERLEGLAVGCQRRSPCRPGALDAVADRRRYPGARLGRAGRAFAVGEQDRAVGAGAAPGALVGILATGGGRQGQGA